MTLPVNTVLLNLTYRLEHRSLRSFVRKNDVLTIYEEKKEIK